jgi:PEP-CTERM motif
MLKLASLLVLTVGLASASTITFTLDQNGCSGGGGCGTPPFATVTLTDNGSGASAFVTVTETLAASERYAGGGAGEALEFNVAGAITITNLTPNFIIGPAPDSASAFGAFLESVQCSTCVGGNAGNPSGPLSFHVGSATGVTTASFIANAGGYFFASDIVGANGNTGNVAAFGGGGGGTLGGVPEPLSLFLMGGGLLGVGIFGKFRRA